MHPLFNILGYNYAMEFDKSWTKTRNMNDKCQGVFLNRNFDFNFDQNSGRISKRFLIWEFQSADKFENLSKPTVHIKNMVELHLKVKMKAKIWSKFYLKKITMPLFLFLDQKFQKWRHHFIEIQMLLDVWGGFLMTLDRQKFVCIKVFDLKRWHILSSRKL